MKVTINIEKRYAFVIGALLLIAVALGVVYAYGGNNPPVMGHSVDEIDGGVCNQNNIEDCPVNATGVDIYIEPAGSYTRGVCQPTCNAQIIEVPHETSAPVCTDYTYAGKYTSSYACTRTSGNVVCDTVGFLSDLDYYCAKKNTNTPTQFIGERFQSNP
jgi:hypothetical protein